MLHCTALLQESRAGLVAERKLVSLYRDVFPLGRPARYVALLQRALDPALVSTALHSAAGYWTVLFRLAQ